jgi:hypothetical protein
LKGDTRSAWAAALAQGPDAIEKYLIAYNKANHRQDCEFRDLPPSVHHALASQYEKLSEASDKLNKARLAT